MKGQSGTTAGTLAVLAVIVAVAVVGALLAARRQPSPPLQVVVDVPAPAAVSQIGGIGAAEAEQAGAREPREATTEAGTAPAPDPPDGRVEALVTAAGNDDSGEPSPPPDPASMAEALDVPPGTGVEAAADPRPPTDPNGVAATSSEPPAGEGAPIPLGGAVVIDRRSNLRAQPGPDAEVLAKLEPGARVFRLDDTPVLGYYRVYYEGVVGWIWWLNVRDGPGGNIEGCLHCDRPPASIARATEPGNPTG